MSEILKLDSESDDEKVQKVWSKGEKCLAPWSADGKLYIGVIKQIKRYGLESVTALVQFDEYPDDDWEEICVSKLKPLPKKKITNKDVSLVIPKEDDAALDDSMFKPLSGVEETSYLQEKYSGLDYDSDDVNITGVSRSGVSSTGVWTGNNSKKKSVVVTGGDKIPLYKTRKYKIKTRNRRLEDDKDKGNTSTQCYSESTAAPSTSSEIPDIPTLNEDLNVTTNNERNFDEMEGFDEEDMEKPKFKFTTSAAKIPFLLSEPGETPLVQVPATINQYLRDYQREGIQFLYSHYNKGRGAILGDDMGLGKTVQVIGFIAAILKKHGNRIDVLRQKPKFIRQMSDNARLLDEFRDVTSLPFLIIGPGSVLYNWVDEFETWGYFTVGKYHAAEKTQCIADLRKGKLEIVMTTFETFRDNVDEMNSIEWAAVFVDEVHKIKGLKAQTTKALRSINTKLRYGLTGTALQNNMEELWCILDWAQPGSLGSIYDFKDEFVNPIEKGLKTDATKRELAQARKKKESFAKIRNQMMIRRTKQLIADQLPVKDDNVVFCKLTDLQIGVYKAILNHSGMEFVMTMEDPCTCGSGIKQKDCHKEAPDGRSLTSLKFTFMHLLLKTASHAALLLPEKSSNQNLSEYSKEVCKYVFEKFPEFFNETKEATFKTLSNPKFCGKMKVLQGLLKIFNRDHSKVLIFSYSTKILDILEQYMMTTGYEYRRLDGSTSMKKRMTIVREFNKDPNIFIFLISTKAGGLGLNLTGANRVVIFDPNWNPTHDLQAQDRAYRIGQRRNVHVYRLISAGTIEENMYLRQVYKQQLGGVAVSSENAKRYFTGIAGDPTQKGELFGWKNMFRLRTGESCLTMDILKRNENLESALGGYNITKYIPLVNNGDNESDTDNVGSDLDTSVDDSTTEDNTEQELAKLFGLNDITEEVEEEISMYSSPESDSESHSRLKRKHVKSQPKTNPKSAGKSSKINIGSGTESSSKSRPRSKNVPNGQSSKVRKETPSKSGTYSSVGDLFEQCGVLHVHENKKVVGTSRAEEHMTRCALQDVYELHQNSQIPAAYCQPYSESEDSDLDVKNLPTKRGAKKKEPDYNASRTMVIGNAKVLIGQTPKAIRQQQFQKLSDHCGTNSLTELAEQIIKGSVSERMDMLRDFYGNQNTEYRQIFDKPDTSQSETMATPKTTLKGTAKKKQSNKKRQVSTRNVKKVKLNQTLGVTFTDISESESQNFLETNMCDIGKSSQGSYEIGKKKSPKKFIKSPVHTRLKSSAKRKIPNCEIHISLNEIAESSVTESYEVPTSGSDSEGDLNTEELLKTMIREPCTQENEVFDVEDRVKNETVDKHENLSVLDDIFMSKESSNTKKRKPPPSFKKKKTGNKYLDELMTEDSSLIDESSCNDEVDGLLNESTLKEDGLDCFSDPQKWKRRKRKTEKSVSKNRHKVSCTDERKVEESFDGSKSLFSF